MTRNEAMEFAREWADMWNRRDVAGILEHFEDDVIFSSPKALDAVGVPTVRGKAAIRCYWETALRPVNVLQFSVVRVTWDADTSELAIIYDRQVNDRRDRAAEVLQFGPSGRVVRGEVFYGVIPG